VLQIVTHTNTHTHTHTYNLKLQSTPHINKGLSSSTIQSLICIVEGRNIWNAYCKINTLQLNLLFTHNNKNWCYYN